MTVSAVRTGRHYLRAGEGSILPVGAHFVPVEGPDWPWRVDESAFDQAFAQMAAAGMSAVRIDLLWSAIEPQPGRYDEDHLHRLDAVLEAARRHGLWLHPTLFIGGEVGDAFWDVPWRDDRHPHRDPEMLRLQAEHAAMLARRWRADPAVIAWDLTDEPPFWLFGGSTEDDDAREWTRVLVDALRAQDPEHLITIGTSGQEIGWGPFRADVVADRLDFGCVHPYPIYQSEVYPDALLSPRMTHAGAFETALASGAGKPVMVHEYGASSAQFEPEAIAAYDRLLSYASLGRGATGFFAWCWTDAEPAAYRRVPYLRQPHETQFGVTDWRGELRPRGAVLAGLAGTAGRLDLDALASDGPAPARAAIPVPHEYVRPYDPDAYGLSEASGLYRPSESAWSPRRIGMTDARPLVRSMLNAFVMASRADLSVSFPRERLDDVWPDVPLLLMPAPLASTTISLWHVRTSFWRGARDFFGRGGVLYLSCSGDVAIPEMDELAGCRLADRAPADRAAVLRFVRPWGPFGEDDELALPRGGAALASRGVRLRASDAETVAVDADGHPALVLAHRGSGSVVTCAYPVETLLAATPDAHGPGDRTWGLYAGLARLVEAPDAASCDHADVTLGELRGPRGGVVTATNHAGRDAAVAIRLPEGAARADRIGPAETSGIDLEDGSVAIELDPYGAAVVGWRRGSGGLKQRARTRER